MWVCMFCIYICDSYASLKTQSSQTLLLNKKKGRKILEPKHHDLSAFPTHVCASFPTQLAWKDGKQFNISWSRSTKHVQIQYKEMLYLNFYRLTTRKLRNFRKPRQVLTKQHVSFFRTLSNYEWSGKYEIKGLSVYSKILISRRVAISNHVIC